MEPPSSFLEDVGDVTRALSSLGLDPVLVGGMALVLRGSTRVTRDFDFVVRNPAAALDAMIGALYERGFELVSRVDDGGAVRATIDNHRIAVTRLRIDAPRSAYFYKHANGLRIDLLFDYPLPAESLSARAENITVGAQRLQVACEADLLRLKKIALSQRTAPGDASDVAFLEARRRSRKKAKRRKATP